MAEAPTVEQEETALMVELGAMVETEEQLFLRAWQLGYWVTITPTVETEEPVVMVEPEVTEETAALLRGTCLLAETEETAVVPMARVHKVLMATQVIARPSVVLSMFVLLSRSTHEGAGGGQLLFFLFLHAAFYRVQLSFVKYR
jgi:hypothetical protein